MELKDVIGEDEDKTQCKLDFLSELQVTKTHNKY